MIHELQRPPDSETASQAVEMLRGWIIDGQPQYVLFPTAWKDDLASWGSFLADTARNISNALAEHTGSDSQTILAAIVAEFHNEIKNPINEHSGEFQKRNDL
jgi:hypothetical protein